MELVIDNQHEKDLIIQYKEELDSNLLKIVKLLKKKENLQKKYARKYPDPKKVEKRATKGLQVTGGIALLCCLISIFNIFNPAIYVDVLLAIAAVSILWGGSIIVMADSRNRRTLKYGLVAKELAQIEGAKKEITRLEERNKELELKISEELHKRATNEKEETNSPTTLILEPKKNIKIEAKRAR